MSKGSGRPSKKALLPEALELKAQGLSNRAIAEQLNVGSGLLSDPKQQVSLIRYSPF